MDAEAPSDPVPLGTRLPISAYAATVPEPAADPTYDVICSLHPDPDDPQGGIPAARNALQAKIADLFPTMEVQFSEFYIQMCATKEQLNILSEDKRVEMIWINHDIQRHLLTSAETVKASACWRTFEARGNGVAWAVLDTGINAQHPHFTALNTVDAKLSASFVNGDPLTDPNGHGTHVAGIIAGAAIKQDGKTYSVATLADGGVSVSVPLSGPPSGLAPMARLVSVQVLQANGGGKTFDAIRGLEYIRKLNQTSRDIRIDGANLSFGYDLEATSYGCGYSPICEEVNRAVNAGICVVVSCGNAGFGVSQTEAAGNSSRTSVGVAISISDPANADLCIAVGSVHKSAPHKYGVSYFSSKGPTLDGRQKPDLVAPGERIYSCNADLTAPDSYIEMSGTSMAAPHVSGAIAAFLSVRSDYRGNPRELKNIFKSTALDLGRNVTYQGSGLVDAFKALTSA